MFVTNLSVDFETIRRNLVQVCADSPKKQLILKAVKRPKSYKEVAKEINANANNCSEALNQMALLGLVEPAGSKGVFRQTPLVRKLDVEGSLDVLDVDPEIIRDCFPLRRPFRTHAGEAYLTLENVIRRELQLPDTVFGAAVVSSARQKGVFNRTVPSETEALVQLYNSAFLWYRNVLHHRKEEMPKEEALKVILHADYLIKLFRKQKQMNSIV